MEQGLDHQIRHELQALKAPADLVARTKEAAAREETKVAQRRKKRIRYVTGGSILAVAAALFLLISPIAFRQGAGEVPSPMSQAGTGNPSSEQWDMAQSESIQSGTWLRLGTVADGREIYLEEEVSLERVKILPMAFRQVDPEETIGGVTVRYARNEDGLWMAAFEDQEAYVVITAQVTEEQEMHEIMEKLLSEAE